GGIALAIRRRESFLLRIGLALLAAIDMVLCPFDLAGAIAHRAVRCLLDNLLGYARSHWKPLHRRIADSKSSPPRGGSLAARPTIAVYSRIRSARPRQYLSGDGTGPPP